ncbi:hypothetical protein AIOL_003958 [Candidatus Rhodobacter oscarellae]|uniref:Ribosomal RNA large subunit methyltransferase K/L-like methyltransferase domain-containing protein n=1 Tax=Candidatus Rhodobacter oscarellae TaxID=1675527 RepID=A0A0J9E8B9_9RHOB|nr:hypothetical protein [Candidatus Rhodobacter lobularis]KMW58977.1 hypothetical protein AIOL_003958 [Candidatus Rhodobacter lobularis]
MPKYALLISPRAEAAYFHQAAEVAFAELSGAVDVAPEVLSHGDMRFLVVDVAEGALPGLLRLSFAQGAFAIEGDAMLPVAQTPGFHLHPDFVWGEKYRGKTNETLTQLLINLALQQVDRPAEELTLLDPMSGRGTTCLWAMRYGMRSVGIEQDKQAPVDIQRGLKKWTKLHRQKHKLSEGWVQKVNKRGAGKYLEFAAEGVSARFITGDTVAARDLLQRKRFDVIATDVPYGVQHQGRGQRSALEVLCEAAPGWAESLAPGGAMAIAFNSYQPKRVALLEAFSGLGLEEVPVAVAHRMSESILRDVLLLRRG